MTKRTAFISIMFLLMLSTPLTASAVMFCLPDQNVDAGAVVAIPVTVDDGDGIKGFIFDVTYDSAVLDCTEALKTDLPADWLLVYNALPGTLRVVAASANALPAGGGSLVTLQCTVKGSPGAQTDMCLDLSDIAGEEGVEIPVIDCGCSVLTVKGDGTTTTTTSTTTVPTTITTTITTTIPTTITTSTSSSIDTTSTTSAITTSTTTITTTTTSVKTTTTTTKPSLCPAETIYGENSEQAELLRKYRDNVLSKTPEGQEIIKTYYKFSPTITKLLEQKPLLKNRAKAYIDRMLPGIRKKVEESNKNP